MINQIPPFGAMFNVLVRALDDTRSYYIHRTLLHTAIMNNDLVYFEALMNAPELRVNCLDEEGRTPLHTAAFYGRYDMVVALLDRGAASNKRDTKGHTPLHDAVNPIFVELTEEHVHIAELLLSRGAKASMESNTGFTPLNWMGKYLSHTGVNEERAGYMLKLANKLIIYGAKADESAVDTYVDANSSESLMSSSKRGHNDEEEIHSHDALSSVHTPLTWAVSLELNDIVRLFESELQVGNTELDAVTSGLTSLSFLSQEKNKKRPRVIDVVDVIAPPNSPEQDDTKDISQSVYGAGL
ncbi:MAG: ankyrin repeat domain-containing protein [Legionellaceae bacterium]|jgi:ankyrin repeat protein|nr:ankyrin repeat domain-containing protein [Legionellaceae bacterium]